MPVTDQVTVPPTARTGRLQLPRPGPLIVQPPTDSLPVLGALLVADGLDVRVGVRVRVGVGVGLVVVGVGVGVSDSVGDGLSDGLSESPGEDGEAAEPGAPPEGPLAAVGLPGEPDIT